MFRNRGQSLNFLMGLVSASLNLATPLAECRYPSLLYQDASGHLKTAKSTESFRGELFKGCWWALGLDGVGFLGRLNPRFCLHAAALTAITGGEA